MKNVGLNTTTNMNFGNLRVSWVYGHVVDLRLIMVLAGFTTLAFLGCSDPEVDEGGGTGEEPYCIDAEHEESNVLDEIDLKTTDLTESERDIHLLYRRIIASLITVNPVSCRELVVVPPIVTAQSVDAFEIFSLVHENPLVRYDVFLYTSRGGVEEAGGQQTVKEIVRATLDRSDVDLHVEQHGAMVVVRTSEVDDTGKIPAEQQQIIDFYNSEALSSEE